MFRVKEGRVGWSRRTFPTDDGSSMCFMQRRGKGGTARTALTVSALTVECGVSVEVELVSALTFIRRVMGERHMRWFSMPSLHAYESLPVSDEPSAKISLLLTHLIERLAYGVNTASQYMCQ